MMNNAPLATEWSVLQNQYDSYEKLSLLIKLFSIGVLVFSYLNHALGAVPLFLLLVLWLQDAIWKTFQSRISIRLLDVERALSQSVDVAKGENNPAVMPFQYNTAYARVRPGLIGLVIEYLRHAVRPTIAYPHVLLVGLVMVYLLDCSF